MSAVVEKTANSTEVARLSVDGKELELPVVVGSEQERGLDISKLLATTGCITLDEGYANTGATTSSITFLDGDRGILRYRGYAIEDLAANCDFLEVAHLLIYGELPTEQQLDDVPRHDPAAHDAARGDAEVLRRLPARRPPDGDPLGRGQRPLDLLSGLARPGRSAAGRNLDPPPAGQAADDRRLQLQEVDRPAVRLSAERPDVLRRTSCR